VTEAPSSGEPYAPGDLLFHLAHVMWGVPAGWQILARHNDVNILWKRAQRSSAGQEGVYVLHDPGVGQ
jgi:hypothetical protein